MQTRSPVVVRSSLALKGMLEKFRADLERAVGPLELHFDATQAILRALAAGESADLVILTAEALDDLRRDGRVSFVEALGASGIGVAVRAGARKPDISTVEAFKRALEEASSVAQSKVGASGLYFSTLVDKLGLQLKARVIIEKGPVGLVVAAGEAEIGIQQLCELAPVPGIDIAGPFPAPLQVMTLFSAAIPANAISPDAARALLQLLGADETRAGMLAGGMEPASK
jgi:molybdate transport system substrate-binding protein